MCNIHVILSPTKYKKLCLGNNVTISIVRTMCLTKRRFLLFSKPHTESQHRLANDNDTTDYTPVMIDTVTTNGVAVELFLIAQAPSNIDVDKNSIQE